MRRGLEASEKTPGPNRYNPEKFTEASHKYSFPMAPKLEDTALYRA
jgi:hypothetical protein